VIWMDGFATISPDWRKNVRAMSERCDLTLTLIDTASDDIRRFVGKSAAKTACCKRWEASQSAGSQTAAAPSMERECDEIA